MSACYGNLRCALVALVALGLAGCGGGGGGGNGGGGGGGGAAPSGSVGGAVAGTTIIALDGAGDIVALDDTADRAGFDVDTDNDLTPDAFSFQLTGLPLDEALRIFLINGGGIHPLYYDSDMDGSYDTNVFTLSTETPVDLGFVDTSFPGEDGKAIPQIDPTDDTTVTAGAPIPAIPEGVNAPPTDGLSLVELSDKGLNALDDGWLLGARTYLEAAVTMAGDSTTNEADTARFLFAVTRVVALGFDTLSDGNSSDMNRLGDILDRLGYANDATRTNHELIGILSPLPEDSPAGNEYRDFLYTVARPELIDAVGNFDAISDTFNRLFDNLDASGPVEVDYADVLFLRGLFKSMLATIATLRAYDLDADIDAISNSNKDVDPGNDITVEDFLTGNMNFLTLVDTTKLAEAKGYLTASALDDLEATIDAILAEVDPQDDDFLTIDMLVDPAAAKDRIAEARDSLLNGARAVGSTMLDLKQFFDVGVDFRSPSTLLPEFTANNVSGPFPDPGFNLVVLAPDLNEDVDPADGVPDILQ